MAEGMFTAVISGYEDHQDISSGHSYTIYNVEVEAKSLNKKWTVRKRYKHFQYLYATLKTEYPNNSDLNNVHFPRKSMFHTFSEQTKIKRRQNFEEFLRVALTIYPMPLCVEDFLDIIDRCGRSYSHSVQKEDSANSHIDKPLPYLYTSPSKKDKLGRRGKDTSLCALDHLSSSDGETNAVMHDILSKKGEAKKMTHVLLSTFLVTTVVYVLFIFLGFIDIQGCTFGRLLLTAVSLGSTLSMIRISLIKRDIRKRQAFIREFQTALKAC